jgi:hypothetical protein
MDMYTGHPKVARWFHVRYSCTPVCRMLCSVESMNSRMLSFQCMTMANQRVIIQLEFQPCRVQAVHKATLSTNADDPPKDFVYLCGQTSYAVNRNEFESHRARA